jgi:hypothetical protein
MKLKKIARKLGLRKRFLALTTAELTRADFHGKQFKLVEQLD